MSTQYEAWSVPTRLAVGFMAGALAAILCHQAMLAFLGSIGWTQVSAYSFAPTAPLGVPRIISLTFWGGVWGMIFIYIQARVPRDGWYWVFAIFLGALMLSAMNWFIWSPLKGNPVAAGWEPLRMRVGLLVNGAWGLGTALIIRLVTRQRIHAFRTPPTHDSAGVAPSKR